jgi:hypothetical protein
LEHLRHQLRLLEAAKEETLYMQSEWLLHFLGTGCVVFMLKVAPPEKLSHTSVDL